MAELDSLQPEVIALLQKMVTPAAAPFAPMGPDYPPLAHSPRELAEQYGYLQGDQSPYSRSPGDLSFVGTTGAMNMRQAVTTWLAQAFFRGEFSARQVQDMAERLIASDPTVFPLQFTDETLRVIGYQPRYQHGQDRRTLLDPDPIPEAFPEPHTGRHILPPVG